jgi:hypothetical protein
MLRIYGGRSVIDRRPPGTRAPKRTANWRFVGPIYGTRRRPTGSNWALIRRTVTIPRHDHPRTHHRPRRSVPNRSRHAVQTTESSGIG